MLGMFAGTAHPREFLSSMYGDPGTPLFKIMIRQGDWKYIFLANEAENSSSTWLRIRPRRGI